MKQMLKETLVIVLITLIAGLGLGVVFEITKEPIEKQKVLAKQKALKAVYNEADDFVETEIVDSSFNSDNADMIELYEALDANDALMGYVMVLTAHNGYGGDITFALGINKDGKTNGISITDIKETAGLGMNAKSVLAPQFADKKVEQFVVTKQTPVLMEHIEAISGATITTDAITSAVNAGLEYYYKELGGANNE